LAIVNDKSLLQRNIEYLQKYGIRDVIVNVHHFPEQIINTLKTNNGWGSNIIISDERNELLETGGGLLKAKDLFNHGERFITCNVDISPILISINLFPFMRKINPLISFGVTDRKTSRYLLFDETNRLCGWRNTKTGEEKIAIQIPDLIQKAYSCVAVFQPEIFSLIPFTGKFSLIDVYLALAAEHKIMGYDHSCDKLVDVGNPNSITIAESIFP
jgi:NDP-sugar pyrophosphorylase family protein